MAGIDYSGGEEVVVIYRDARSSPIDVTASGSTGRPPERGELEQETCDVIKT